MKMCLSKSIDMSRGQVLAYPYYFIKLPLNIVKTNGKHVT